MAWHPLIIYTQYQTIRNAFLERHLQMHECIVTIYLFWPAISLAVLTSECQAENAEINFIK